MWKSTDGGAHWQSLGLADTRQIGRILVDPHDAKRLAGRGAGSRIRAKHRAGRLPLDGWRPDLDQGALPRRAHRGDRSRLRSRRPPGRLRGAVAGTAHPVESVSARRRSGQRTVQVDGRRRDVDRDHRARAARRSARPRRSRCRARLGRRDRLRALLGSRRLARGSTAPTTAARRGGWRGATRASGAAGTSASCSSTRRTPTWSTSQPVHSQVDGRRSHVRSDQRRARRRRLPLHVDRPDESAPPGVRERPGRGRELECGLHVERLVQSADGPVLPRDHRLAVALHDLRRAAGRRERSRSPVAATSARSPFATGFRPAQARAATSRPTRATPRSSTAAGTYGELFRFDRTTGQLQDIRPWPRGAFGTPHAGPEVPLRVDVAAGVRSDRQAHPVLRLADSAPHDRRGSPLAGGQPRPYGRRARHATRGRGADGG